MEDQNVFKFNKGMTKLIYETASAYLYDFIEIAIQTYDIDKLERLFALLKIYDEKDFEK